MADNFDSPGFDYASQQTKIRRKLALANALQQQGLQPLETNRMAGGWAIPISPFEGAAKLLQTYAGGKLTDRASEDQKALADTAQKDYREALIKGLGASGIPDESIESIAALGSNPMTQQLIPGAVSWGQQQRMIKMLPQVLAQLGGQGAPSGPQAGQGTVLAPGMSGAPQGAQGPSLPTGSNMILASGMLGMPGLAKIGENQFEQSKPIVQREGGLTDWQGNQITPPLPKAPEGFGLNRTASGYELYQLPGAQGVAPFKAGIAGQESLAQTQNTLHNVPMASGATVPMLGSNIPGVSPPVPQQRPIPMPQQRPPIPQQAIPMPGQPPAIDASQGVPRGVPMSSIPEGTPLPKQPVGVRAKGDPWSTMPKMPVPSGVGQGTYQKMTAENQASQAKTLIEENSKNAQESNSRIAINTQALDLVDKADTGPGAAVIADVKNVLTSRFGLPESDFKNTPSATMVLNKDLMNAAISKARQVFNNPRMTQMEVMTYLQKGAPNVDMPKAAIKFLLNTDNAQAQYAIQKSSDLSRYVNNGGDPTQFEAWYAKTFPLSKVLDQYSIGGKGQASTQTLHWNDLK